MTKKKDQPNQNPASDLDGYVEKLLNATKTGLPFQTPGPSDSHYVHTLFKNAKRNEYLDRLNLDWIYKAFPFPEIIFNEKLFMASLRREVTNPTDAIKLFLELRNFPNTIPSKLFYTKVICNAHG